MADGETHNLVSKLSALPAAGIAITLTGDWAMGAAVALGCLSGMVLTPDLDCIETPVVTKAEEWMRKVPLLGIIMVWYWMPYAMLIPHRHALSHTPVLGTLLRLVYLTPLLLMATALVYAYGPEGAVITMYQWLRSPVMFGWVLGLMISDFMHYLFDVA